MPVTRSGLVAACITTAVAASILTATIFSFGSGIGKLVDGGTAVSSVSSDSSGTVSKTAIVTESTDEAVVEAVAENVGPSVVGVVVTSAVNNFFYGGSSQSSQGSGIIYSEDGYIITNYHVISEAVESNGTLKVYLPSDVENAIDAAVIGLSLIHILFMLCRL